ncbi:MAG: transcriptional regulator [Candidatus Magasanikbacteria bacterium RIFCSPLOWO2_02_FULL_44_11]|uniref:Transcriptional regulator n=2 Tax=Candidatus Magasanikiibacteriota TaxID=1752731 RepID=A0A1F6N9R1_9BACT|nr:MAG: transcriptional regulator [Candidatus Magasanikbacteria bacterium RIFCSPHIGHO2_02_FULL_45_10]OGH80508.1 MAG: transcriptional regulator [Candidatus Magasanikbacteria bacterium RIFCSPLOWO2_02_FULL_44_11]
MYSYTQFKKKFLKNPANLRAYNELETEFSLIEAIIEKRLARGFTQAMLAKKIGTKQSSIARLESGTYNPSIAFLDKIAQALDAHLSISLL